MPRLGVARRDGDVIDQAEAARNGRRGVMAGRADRGEGRLRLARHHRVDRQDGGTRSMLHGRRAAFAHHRVAVDMDALAGRRPHAQDRLDIVLRMDARHRLDRGRRRGGAHEAGERRILQRGQHRLQALGPLGMMWPGIVVEERGMADQQSRHGAPPDFVAPIIAC